MTSCLLPLFFLFSLCASIPLKPSERPGLKVRVTEKGLDVVKDFVIVFFKALKDQAFPPMEFSKGTINNLTFTKLDANKKNLVLTLTESTGSLLIEIKNMPFHVHLKREVNKKWYTQFLSAESDLTGDGADGELYLKMDLQLKRTEGGKLGITMLACDANKITIKSNTKLGWIIDKVLSLGGYLEVCASLKDKALPKMNSMLEKLSMLKVVEGLSLTMDYSVNQDITVTHSGLNLPLRGLVYLEGDEVTLNTEGADLDLGTEREQMLYLGISDFFLKSLAASLYRGGAMTKTWDKMDNVYLKFFQKIKNLRWSNEDISVEISITEVPIIHITLEEGIFVKPKFTIRALSGEEKPKDFLELSVECSIYVKVEVKGENLIAPAESIKCDLLTKKPQIAESIVWWTGTIKARLEGVLRDGVKLPLPPNIIFVQGSVNYHEGFMVLAGSLDWTAEAMMTQAEAIRDQCFGKLA